MQGDLYRRIRGLAEDRRITFDDVKINVVNRYRLMGLFVRGTAEGHAEPPEIEVRTQGSASPEDVAVLVSAALDVSPAIAVLREPLTNTFALYINGRRRRVEGVPGSPASDVPDPYRVYGKAPRPLEGSVVRADLIERTGQIEEGAPQPAPASTATPLTRKVYGKGTLSNPTGLYEVETWLGLPGASHFRFRSDEGSTGAAPSGLALLSAGIAFCYMTQLSRYIENMKMQIRGARLVQFNPLSINRSHAVAEAIDTHLFLNGEASDDMHIKLLTIAARTCYLHATAATALEPLVRIVHNGIPVELSLGSGPS